MTAFARDPHTAFNGAHGGYNSSINQLILVVLFIVVVGRQLREAMSRSF
jgi:hypothetical protein